MAHDADLADFEAVWRPPGMPMKINVILADLDRDQPDRAVALRKALAASRYSDQVVATTVTGWGISVSEAAVRNWRRNHRG